MMRKPSTIRHFAPACIPYAAILIGLYAFASAWTAVLLYYGGVLALFLPRRREIARRFVGWDSRAAALLAGFGALGGALLYALWPWLGIEEGISSRLGRVGLAGPAWPVFLAYFALLNPLLEEALWRERLQVVSPALHPVDVLFAGYHLLVLGLFLPAPWVAATAVAFVLASWQWRRMAARTGGILVPFLSHLAADVSVAIALYLRV